MIKKITLILLSFTLLGSFCCFAETTAKDILHYDFENKPEISFVCDSGSGVEISEIFSSYGSLTQALRLYGTGAVFTYSEEIDLQNSVLSFDFLPYNLSKEGFVLLSIYSGAYEIPLVSVYDEGITFGGVTVLEFIHKDWYNFKLVAGMTSVKIFIDGRVEDEVELELDLMSLSSAGYRFSVAGKYNFKPMMWSDMFFRLGEPQCDYDISAVLPGDADERLPKNLKMVYWEYGVEDKDIIEHTIDMHSVLGREVIYAGGIWTWNRMVANMEKTFATARAQLAACKKKGIKHVFVTIWGSGTQNAYNIYSVLPGLQMYAEQNYGDTVSDKKIAEMFKVCTGYDLDAFKTLYFDDFTPEEKDKYKTTEKICFAVNPSYQHLFNDILIGLLDKTLSGFDFKSRYREILNKFETTEVPGDIKWLFDMTKLLAEILYSKCDLGLRLQKSYKDKNSEDIKLLLAELKVLCEKYKQFQILFGESWHKAYKPFGFEAINIELGGIEARVNWAVHRIEQYLNNEIEKIDELEPERFYFREMEKPLFESNGSRTFISCAYGMN